MKGLCMIGMTKDQMMVWANEYLEHLTMADGIETAVEVYTQLVGSGHPLSLEEIFAQWPSDITRHPRLIVILLLQGPIAAGSFFQDTHGRYGLSEWLTSRAVESSPSLAPSVRFAILKRDAYRCRLCGASTKDGKDIRLEVDHITPRARGGTDDQSNLWTLCFPCNRGKGIHAL